MGKLKQGLDWLDNRTGYRHVIDVALQEQVPGGASFAYVFGSVLTFVLLLQMTTGIFLAMYYSPSATDAWGSVAHIQDGVTMGWFVRGLHSYGASAMVILAGLHMLQTATYGAYKKPRELNWIIGVLMLGLIMAFALTGYLLPWDQTGYWATKVATGIAGSSPVIGQELQQVVQGGNEYGNLTLTRFYAIHVFILPALLIGLVVAHIALFRRHGVTPRWGRSKDELARTTQPFWPDQMFKDMVAIVITFGVLVGVNLSTHGVPLEGPADPASNFDARPEWYFRPLFQLLKYFEGPMEQVVALGLPVVVGGVLIALPFIDRGEDRNPKARIKQLSLLAIGFLAAGLFTALSFSEDANDPGFQKRAKQAHAKATLARSLAKEYGVPAAGGVAVYSQQPHYEAKRLWSKHCKSCHEGKERKAPEIVAGYNSRAWVRAFLLDPNDKRFFGVTEIKKMKPVKQRGVKLDALVEFIYAQTGATNINQALVTQGAKIYEDDCASKCHVAKGEAFEGDGAPDVYGRGGTDYLVDFIADPGQKRYFGKLNIVGGGKSGGDDDDDDDDDDQDAKPKVKKPIELLMPKFDRRLNDDQRRLLAEYLRSLRDIQ